VRILIVDDETGMHDAYRRTLCTPEACANQAALAALASELFEDATAPDETVEKEHFELTHAMQGLEAVAIIEESRRTGDPFKVAFIDIRMPPGIDGKETAQRIRAIDPDINIVIVTGYSDYRPIDIARVAGPIDKIFYITKPFDADEVYQAASALGHRWEVDKKLSQTQSDLAEKILLLEEQGIALAANEARAVHMANHDLLTGIPNRRAFSRELAERVQLSGARFAVAMLDLDRFKNVNDTLGHAAGDELIRLVCAKITAQLDKGVVARLGGDEFGILYDAADDAAAIACCERIIESCSSSYMILGHSVQVSASIGVVLSKSDLDDGSMDYMRLADLALYEAKRSGRNQVRLFDGGMDESVRFRQMIEAGLRGAIEKQELEVVFQPIVERENLEIVGFEALLRWTSAEHGSISPAVFIPIAEESNLIHELGEWVTAEALRECARWPHHYVSINFSPRQFRRQTLVQSLADAAVAAGVPPQRIQIEITETAIFDDDLRAAETLQQLRALGFRVALDDFGTGYSSLFNIRSFALDCVKIDKSFIDGLGRESESAAIVNSVTHLARCLGLGVVAEGVETEAQNQALRLAGCSHLQGYYFGRPRDAAYTCDLAFGRAEDEASSSTGNRRFLS